jgi:hypothetical protein
LTIDHARGRQGEPVWRSNWSAAWSRKNFRRRRGSISVWLSAVRRASSTDRILGAILVPLAAFLHLPVVVEFAFDPAAGEVEEIDGPPQQLLEVGFEACVAQRHDQGIKDVGNGALDEAGFGQWPRVGIVLEGAVAVELEFGEDLFGRG